MSEPLPVAQYAANAPLHALGTAAAFLVMTVRLWAAPGREGAPVWREGLIVTGIDRAASPPFDRLLRLLSSSRRALDVRGQQCPRLGRDEALLLECVSLLQHEQRPQAEQILGLWLRPAAQRMALIAALQLSAALSGARLRIPRCASLPRSVAPLRRRAVAAPEWRLAQSQPEI